MPILLKDKTYLNRGKFFSWIKLFPLLARLDSVYNLTMLKKELLWT